MDVGEPVGAERGTYTDWLLTNLPVLFTVLALKLLQLLKLLPPVIVLFDSGGRGGIVMFNSAGPDGVMVMFGSAGRGGSVLETVGAAGIGATPDAEEGTAVGTWVGKPTIMVSSSSPSCADCKLRASCCFASVPPSKLGGAAVFISAVWGASEACDASGSG